MTSSMPLTYRAPCPGKQSPLSYLDTKSPSIKFHFQNRPRKVLPTSSYCFEAVCSCQSLVSMTFCFLPSYLYFFSVPAWRILVCNWFTFPVFSSSQFLGLSQIFPDIHGVSHVIPSGQHTKNYGNHYIFWANHPTIFFSSSFSANLQPSSTIDHENTP